MNEPRRIAGYYRSRLWVAAGVFGALVLAALSCIVHAHTVLARRAQERAAVAALARVLPMSDLALSGGARWLRAPTLEDPWAAFADGPAAHNANPAGAVLSPPRDVYFGVPEGP